MKILIKIDCEFEFSSSRMLLQLLMRHHHHRIPIGDQLLDNFKHIDLLIWLIFAMILTKILISLKYKSANKIMVKKGLSLQRLNMFLIKYSIWCHQESIIRCQFNISFTILKPFLSIFEQKRILVKLSVAKRGHEAKHTFFEKLLHN